MFLLWVSRNPGNVEGDKKPPNEEAVVGDMGPSGPSPQDQWQFYLLMHPEVPQNFMV